MEPATLAVTKSFQSDKTFQFDGDNELLQDMAHDLETAIEEADFKPERRLISKW